MEIPNSSKVATVLAGIIRPELTPQIIHKTEKSFLLGLFSIKLHALISKVKKLPAHTPILIPAVQGNWDQENTGPYPLLPAFHFYMRYVLLHKQENEEYIAEIIERGPMHARTYAWKIFYMEPFLKLLLTNRFTRIDNHKLLRYLDYDATLDPLGNQGPLQNCVITNLFAAAQIYYNQMPSNDFANLCQEVKELAKLNFSFYKHDFYPFGDPNNEDNLNNEYYLI